MYSFSFAPTTAYEYTIYFIRSLTNDSLYSLADTDRFVYLHTILKKIIIRLVRKLYYANLDELNENSRSKNLK